MLLFSSLGQPYSRLSSSECLLGQRGTGECLGKGKRCYQVHEKHSSGPELRGAGLDKRRADANGISFLFPLFSLLEVCKYLGNFSVPFLLAVHCPARTWHLSKAHDLSSFHLEGKLEWEPGYPKLCQIYLTAQTIPPHSPRTSHLPPSSSSHS